MLYILEVEYCDNGGGGIYGPFKFDNREEAFKTFNDAVNNQFEEVNYREDKHCFGATLYQVDYREGTSKVVLSFDDTGI